MSTQRLNKASGRSSARRFSFCKSVASAGTLSNSPGSSGSFVELRRSKLAQDPRGVSVSVQDETDDRLAID